MKMCQKKISFFCVDIQTYMSQLFFFFFVTHEFSFDSCNVQKQLNFPGLSVKCQLLVLNVERWLNAACRFLAISSSHFDSVCHFCPCEKSAVAI